jgi:hypothetical protein
VSDSNNRGMAHSIVGIVQQFKEPRTGRRFRANLDVYRVGPIRRQGGRPGRNQVQRGLPHVSVGIIQRLKQH